MRPLNHLVELLNFSHRRPCTKDSSANVLVIEVSEQVLTAISDCGRQLIKSNSHPVTRLFYDLTPTLLCLYKYFLHENIIENVQYLHLQLRCKFSKFSTINETYEIYPQAKCWLFRDGNIGVGGGAPILYPVKLL